MSKVSTYSIVDKRLQYGQCHVRILNYSTMPDEVDNKLLLGVELEVEYKKRIEFYERQLTDRPVEQYLTPGQVKQNTEFYRIANLAQDAFGRNAALKWEGTVACGFEVVTAPATLRFHKEALWGNFFEVAGEYLAGKRNCGMHIHVNREPLSEMTQAKLITFIHDRRNGGFLSKIAGRSVSAHASWCKTKRISYKDPNDKIIKENSYQRDAISVSSSTGGKTFEIRIFASIPTKQGVFQAIEFVAALIEYLDQSSTLEKDNSYLRFLAWFAAERKNATYPYLATRLRGLRMLRTFFMRFTRKAA